MNHASADIRAPHGPRILASVVALATASLPFVADWNQTHLHNPRWTGHARFHSAQTMALGAALGLLALVYIWRRGRLVDGLVVASLYWITQAVAALFPGTALIDPEFADRMPVVGGVRLNQLYGVAVFLTLLAGSYVWSRQARDGSTSPERVSRRMGAEIAILTEPRQPGSW